MIKDLLKRCYSRLPILKELQQNAAKLHEQNTLLRDIRNAVCVQTLEIIKNSDPRYREPKRLLVHGAQYWSQHYEDGMIEEVFNRIGIKNNSFLEIGVGDGAENNTTYLLSKGWHGWWIDGDA